MKITAKDLIAEARGLPTHIVTAELNRVTPGIDWNGCGKQQALRDAMEAPYCRPMAQASARVLRDRLRELRRLMSELDCTALEARNEMWRRERL